MKKFAVEFDETKRVSYDDEYAKYLITDFVNEAMTKRDRTVSIFLGRYGVSINISPLRDEEE